MRPRGRSRRCCTARSPIPALLRQLARRCEVVTFDWENVSVDSLRALRREHGARICPPVAALATGQDRVAEKRLFEKLKIPTTRWRAVDSRAELTRAVARHRPAGRAQDAPPRLRRQGTGGAAHAGRRASAPGSGSARVPLLYEECVPFDCEVSIIGARSTRGELAIYPLCGNVHADGILRLTRAPYGPRALAARGRRATWRRVLAHFRYTGILTIEFFVRDGRLIANEMAPRVHNSGHWTIEGAA